jgi:TolB-like protein
MRRWAAFLLLMLLGAATTAEAQVTRRPTAAVLEIQVHAPSGSSRTLRRAATDAVAAEMSRRNLFVVKPRNATEKAIKDLGFHHPLKRHEIDRIGLKLDVDRVVYGEVTDISFTERPRRAQVKLSLSIINLMIWEPEYSTSKTGDTPAAATDTDIALIEQAVTRAAEAAFDSYTTTPTADILAKEGEDLVLNVGSRDGLHVGDEAVLVRGQHRLARLRIHWISATRSKASFVDGGRKTSSWDKAVFIYVPRNDDLEK